MWSYCSNFGVLSRQQLAGALVFVEKLGNSVCSRPLKTNKNHTRSDAVGFFGVSNSHTTKFSTKWQHCVKQTSNRPPPALPLPLPLPLPLLQPRLPLPLLPRPPRLLPRPSGILTKNKQNPNSFSVRKYYSNSSFCPGNSSPMLPFW